ncbi:MAG: DUF3990 domain-containing protein, partial [Butyrivibrio sp.]|nr:DUF3990 domain-containing protein [Butyrivibrio sp.]
MSILTIYHGSDHIVEKPALGQGRKDNDYGQGFYCTEHMDMAREWAVDAHRDGYVNTYQMEVDGLQIVRLNAADYCILHWITILLQNRHFELETPLAREAYRYLCSHFDLDLSGMDLIIGYRADDSYFSYA